MHVCTHQSYALEIQQKYACLPRLAVTDSQLTSRHINKSLTNRHNRLLTILSQKQQLIHNADVHFQQEPNDNTILGYNERGI